MVSGHERFFSHFICCEECGDLKLTTNLQIALFHIGSVPSSWLETAAVRKCEDSSISVPKLFFSF